MTDAIIAGNIFLQRDIHLPELLLLQKDADSNGWVGVTGERSTFERTIQEAGWTFFFLAGEVKATAFGFNRQESLRTALKRLITGVKSQHCNGIEITRVTGRSFLGVPYVSVSAHSRHLQRGLVFSEDNHSI
jgi:hypothetical protein